MGFEVKTNLRSLPIFSIYNIAFTMKFSEVPVIIWKGQLYMLSSICKELRKIKKLVVSNYFSFHCNTFMVAYIKSSLKHFINIHIRGMLWQGFLNTIHMFHFPACPCCMHIQDTYNMHIDSLQNAAPVKRSQI